MPPVIGSQAFQQGVLSGLLQIRSDGRVHHVAIVIGGVTKALHHFLADHLRNIIGVDFDNLSIERRRDRGALGD